ncbi:MAG: ankyrin repeat domain-containing protein [Oligoflexia bacterium]|nr:ankyrin repeat domain-containing protein [Oligoflexia bacterium]
MKKYLPILKDGFTLLVVSTLFVTVVNQLFKGLKKNTQSDSLVTAILQENSDSAKEILTDATRASRTDENGRTPLMWAAYVNIADAKQLADADAKRAAFVPLLLKSGAAIDAQDRDGWTPLMWAAWSGIPQTTQELLAQNANLNQSDRQGYTALMIAVQRGHLPIVKLLLEKGADKAAADRLGRRAADFAQQGLQKYPRKAESYQGIASLLGAS